MSFSDREMLEFFLKGGKVKKLKPEPPPDSPENPIFPKGVQIQGQARGNLRLPTKHVPWGWKE